MLRSVDIPGLTLQEAPNWWMRRAMNFTRNLGPIVLSALSYVWLTVSFSPKSRVIVFFKPHEGQRVPWKTHGTLAQAW